MAAKITKLNDDTFMLTDRLIRVNQFLLRGKKSALLLDTGYGGENFLKAVKKLAALPVIAANTHLHPDHSGGNYLFERVYVGEADLPQKGMPSNDLARGVAQYYREHTHIPKAIISKVESFGIIKPKGEEYLPLPKVFDLGGRQVFTLPCPGHTPGCALFLDERDKTVYAGDTINPAFWAFTTPSARLTAYADVWEGLKGELGGYEKIRISHHAEPLDMGYIDAFIKNLRSLTEKDGKPSFIKGGTPEPVYIYKRQDEKYGDMAVWAYPSQVR